MKASVLVTGSSSGFGALICRELLKRGHNALATMRDPGGRNSKAASMLRDFAEGQPGTVHVVDLDVTSDASAEEAVRQCIALSGAIDVVVNNAGFGGAGYTEAFTVAQMEAMFSVNLFGVHRVNRAVLPAMRERGQGLLVHIGSTMGRLVLPYAGLYTSTKFALEGYVESLRYGLRPTGVDVVMVEPGGFGTGFFSAMQSPEDSVCVQSYGEFSDLPEQAWGGMGSVTEGPTAPNPVEVAVAVADLIESAPGSRPLRTVVDPLSGPEATERINDACAKVQSEVLAAFGLSHLLR